MSTGKALHCERMRSFPHDEKTLPKKVENGASHMSSKNLVVEPSLLDNCSWEKKVMRVTSHQFAHQFAQLFLACQGENKIRQVH